MRVCFIAIAVACVFGTIARSRGHEEDREQGTIHGVVYGPEVGRTS